MRLPFLKNIRNKMRSGSRRRVYILPTRRGYFFFFCLLLIFITALAFQSEPAFLLVFFLFSAALVSMFWAHFNLAGLDVSFPQLGEGFAGESILLKGNFIQQMARERFAIMITTENKNQETGDFLENFGRADFAGFSLKMHVHQRGRYPYPLFLAQSIFPLGLFRSWMWLKVVGHHYYVYPSPSGSREFPKGNRLFPGNDASLKMGSDDFFGHRIYQGGDSLRQIDWKALAKGRPLMTKIFHSDEGAGCVYLDWNDVNGRYDNDESRLSQLCLWIVMAHSRRLHYGLRLPNHELIPDSGDQHYRNCLRALAEWRQEP